MTKQEIETHFAEAVKWIQDQRVRLLNFTNGVSFTIRKGDTYLDDNFTICLYAHPHVPQGDVMIIDVTLSDGSIHSSKLHPGNIDQVGLEYKVEFLKQWPTIKSWVNAFIGETNAAARHKEVTVADREKELCDSITEFTL